jgi:hypothetical protein
MISSFLRSIAALGAMAVALMTPSPAQAARSQLSFI